MKILLIHNKYQQPGGEDAVFQAESELLSGNGHSVEHLLYDNADLQTLKEKVLVGFRAFFNPQSAKALQKKIDDFHPEVIHVHNFVPLVSPSIFFVARRNGIPVIMTLHNFRLICPSATLFYDGHLYEKSLATRFPFDAVLKGVYRDSILQTAVVALMVWSHGLLGTWRDKVDFYIALTNFAKEKFIKSSLSIPPEKIIVKPNSVSDYGYAIQARRDFFLFVGRLVEEKGIRTLLNATKLYRFRLIIVGDGPLRQEVAECASANPLIEYVGQQDKSTVIRYLKSCKALIFPSIWFEGFPVTLLEAFSTGTLVIASKLGAMAEIIRHKMNGLHFAPGDERDLASRIREVAEELVCAQAISENARSTYLESGTPKRNYESLIKIYQKAIALRGHSNGRWNGIHEPRWKPSGFQELRELGKSYRN